MRVTVVLMPFPKPGGMNFPDRVAKHAIMDSAQRSEAPADVVIGVWPDRSQLVAFGEAEVTVVRR